MELQENKHLGNKTWMYYIEILVIVRCVIMSLYCRFFWTVYMRVSMGFTD